MITPPKRMVGVIMIKPVEKTVDPQADAIGIAGPTGCAAVDTLSSSLSSEESRGVNQEGASVLDDTSRHIKAIEYWASSDHSLRGQELRDAADEMQRLVDFVRTLSEALNIAKNVIESQEAEIQFTTKILDRLSDILQKTAIALRGPEPPLTRHTFHDIPDRVAKVMHPLTDEMIESLMPIPQASIRNFERWNRFEMRWFARAIERSHGIGLVPDQSDCRGKK